MVCCPIDPDSRGVIGLLCCEYCVFESLLSELKGLFLLSCSAYRRSCRGGPGGASCRKNSLSICLISGGSLGAMSYMGVLYIIGYIPGGGPISMGCRGPCPGGKGGPAPDGKGGYIIPGGPGGPLKGGWGYCCMWGGTDCMCRWGMWGGGPMCGG